MCILNQTFQAIKYLTSFCDLGSPFEQEDIKGDNVERLGRALDECSISKQNDEFFEEDHTDVCFLVDNKQFRCHRFLLGARSEYLKARTIGNNIGCSIGNITIGRT